MGRGIAVLMLCAASGCLIDIDYTGTAFLCSQDGVCPDGFGCVSGVCVEGAEPDDAGAADFAFTRQLVFDNAGRGELSGFVVLVTLDSSRFDYTAAQADGADIQFRDADGAVIPHEIEIWDPAGTSRVWVRVPTIDADSTTDSISMDYGDPNASDSQNPGAVWSDYQAVYHLRDDLTDSTDNDLDGINSGSTGTAGFIGPARAFNGVDQHVDLGTDRPFLQNVAGFTLSLWANPAEVTGADSVVFASSIDNLGAPTTDSRAQLIVLAGLDVEGGARSIDGGDIAIVQSGAVTVPINDWSWLTVVADFPADTLTLYIDGAEVGSTTGHGFAPTSADSVSTQTVIGSDDDLTGNHFSGAIDAVHLRTDAQDADWVAAQNASMTDVMISYGDEQSL